MTLLDLQQAPTDLGTINEGMSLYLTGSLQDHAGVVIPSAGVSTLKLWVTDEATGAVINGRSGVSILNTNGGTLHATSGAWTLLLRSADAPIVTPGTGYERHLVLVEWTYNGGADKGSKEMVVTVRNLSQV